VCGTPSTLRFHALDDVALDFKARKSGHVINIGSIAGREPYAGGSIYTATKHAVRAFTGSMIRELVNTPIRVTEVQPGSSG
jgi:3-hydroxy acid dehydrogenase/malonic semialdehyde reductase